MAQFKERIIISIVGNTNVGKSTLFNSLSGADVLAQDMLFATLDPTLRKIKLASGREVIFSDTVGFISDLPHELIMAFRSTLEEVLEADIIVHVRDIANEDTSAQKKDVLEVLDNLGLKEIETQANYIEVLNKIDLLSKEDRLLLEQKIVNQSKEVILLSAVSGQGCKELCLKVDNILSSAYKKYTLYVDATDGKLQAWIYKNAVVIDKKLEDDKILFEIKIDEKNFQRLIKTFPVQI